MGYCLYNLPLLAVLPSSLPPSLPPSRLEKDGKLERALVCYQEALADDPTRGGTREKLLALRKVLERKVSRYGKDCRVPVCFRLPLLRLFCFFLYTAHTLHTTLFVCVCMSVCMCVCLFVCVYVCMCMCSMYHVYVCVCECMYVYMYVHVFYVPCVCMCV